MHRFDAAINVVIFENSLPLGERRFYRICGVGKDLKYRSTSAPLPPCTCLPQAGLRQTRRLQDLGCKKTIRVVAKRSSSLRRTSMYASFLSLSAPGIWSFLLCHPVFCKNLIFYDAIIL